MGTKKSQRGQSFIEYLIIIAVVAIAGLATVSLFGTAISGQFEDINLIISNLLGKKGGS